MVQLFPVKSISQLKRLQWDQMTREERVRLMIADSEAYIEKVPEGHWLDILDGIAKGPQQ